MIALFYEMFLALQLFLHCLFASCSAVYNLKPILRIIKTITSHTTNIFYLDVSVRARDHQKKLFQFFFLFLPR